MVGVVVFFAILLVSTGVFHVRHPSEASATLLFAIGTLLVVFSVLLFIGRP